MDSKYDNFGPVDFVTDDRFLRHRLVPTAESDAFWKTLLEQNPHLVAQWLEAVDLLDAVRLGLTSYSRNYLSEEDEARLLTRILQANKSYENSSSRPVKNLAWGRWAAAACGLVALAATGYFALQKAVPEKLTYEKRIESLSRVATVVRHKNVSGRQETYYLPDSSFVLLDAGSGLSLTSEYGNKKREIYLTGKAVLDVVPNAGKPFFVYANEIVTKVLGTKFEIVAYDDDSDITVKVLSGKVTVYRSDEAKAEEPNVMNSAAVLLLPNQQVVFNRSVAHFDKKLVDKPTPLVTGKGFPKFEYEDGPAIAFFDDLEKAYGVRVVYNADLMKNCQLSAVLTDESMLEKMDVVCKTIGATYEIIDAQIIVTTAGCAN